MKCTCPKCRQSIELILPEVSEEGKSASCPACKANFTVYKESFGARALRRPGEISCSSCGNELGPQMHCASCGRPYPDYLVAALGRRKAGKKAQKLKITSSPFRKSQSTIGQLPSLDGVAPQTPPAAARGGQRFSKGVVLATALLVLVALLAAGAGIYLKKKAESNYVKNFVLAAYGMQVGIDTSRKACQKMADDWKAGVAAGKVVTPRPTPVQEKQLARVQSELASLKSQLAKEPEKFKDCNAKLSKLEGVYGKMQTLAMTPGNSLPAFTNSVDKMDAEYKQVAKQFKAEIPAELLAQLKSSSQKFRHLQQLLQ